MNCFYCNEPIVGGKYAIAYLGGSESPPKRLNEECVEQFQKIHNLGEDMIEHVEHVDDTGDAEWTPEAGPSAS